MSSTIPSTEDLVRTALSPMMNLPENYRDLLLKNEITDPDDWNEASDRIAEAAAANNCIQLMQGDLNPFWEANKSFGAMLDSITAICGYNP